MKQTQTPAATARRRPMDRSKDELRRLMITRYIQSIRGDLAKAKAENAMLRKENAALRRAALERGGGG